jgi:hypothetical protein
MKSLVSNLGLPFGLLLFVTAILSPSLVHAEDAGMWRSRIAALSSADSCQKNPSGANVSPELTCRSGRPAGSGPRLAGVTCGANQWCCKHDIGGSGECTKCCDK